MSVNPVLALVSRADTLATGFQQAYERTLPAIHSLETLPSDDPRTEACMQMLRHGLDGMEEQTQAMMNMLYEVDVYMAPSTVQNAAGFNPQEALAHVSDLFHSYQSELLAKRESLADFTCEDISLEEFAQQWRTLDAVQQGRQQGMDELADLLAQFG
ncbi:hypothetical protein ACI68E_000568 [Malassezia pachydermatis]|uniref:Uncharacterized protein n=1 Tax=Malassezia pachydermatis TaxID=77020 RepID=A0A0M9VQJ7_9BASI|nr:hypothetical protein Malapachy_2403 [Malassezia pachydermatis]KOS15612.1 hypothetical protein Malapachy_2403 [Malassezia pachydermatis]